MTLFDEEDCINCGVRFGVPSGYQARRKSDKRLFYCPNGHSMVYCESEADVLRRERDRLKQDAARLQDEIRAAQARTVHERLGRKLAERRVSAAKGQITKIKNRQAAGVCPCCDATFVNLRQHMKSKHADYEAREIVLEDAAEVDDGASSRPPVIADAVPGMNNNPPSKPHDQ